MQDAKNNVAGAGGTGFVNLIERADLERVLLPYKGTLQYETVIRYYQACTSLLDASRLLQPLALFKQALAELGKHRVRREAENAPALSPESASAPDLAEVSDQVASFETRLRFSIELMKTPATPVPKILHFVWLGGGIGDIQRDYINVWKKVLAGHGYKINLWYDSDALLAHQATRLIVEAAKADTMLHGGVDSTSERELGELYVGRAVALKQQMYEHINDLTAKGQSADSARTQLLVSAYGQKAADLERLKKLNLQSINALAEGGLQVRDLAGAEKPLQLQEIYQREMRFRGNFAAASDVVRAEVLHLEGGGYTDIDNLPPLLRTVGGVDISHFSEDARLGFLQMLLNENPQWMPGRQALQSRYTDRTGYVPEEHRSVLQAFAKNRPSLAQVFEVPRDLLVRPHGLRGVAIRNTISNAYMLAHPGSAMVGTVLDRFRFNYGLVDSTARLALQRGVGLEDYEAMADLANEVLERAYGPLLELDLGESIFAAFLADGVTSYYGDGIRPESEGTIYLTGPASVRDAARDFAKAHLTAEVATASRAEMAIDALQINRATEEELDHSWKDNETDKPQWVIAEKQRWHDEQFKTRYAGDIGELLKHSTVEFELGWPIIEGRHVLNTNILQRMADRLGESFTNAMTNGYDGKVVFAESLGLSFDDRQAIRNQDPRLRPPVTLHNEKAPAQAVDEILLQLGEKDVQLLHLNPLQRLTLGALLGAGSLDDQSFAALQSTTENLINSIRGRGAAERYAVIERQLNEQMAPAFQQGLENRVDKFPLRSPNSLSLKKTALSKAATLFDWGRQVAQIREVANLEHREQVTERVDQVLNQFEATTVRMVPQDMLNPASDKATATAGRCFALALAMSAALTRGDAAAAQLRARIFLAGDPSSATDTQNFLDILEQLRGVPVSSEEAGSVGSGLGRGTLDKAVAILDAVPGTRTLMLNSDNHSMLMAKTLRGSVAIYHFYDPNFGVFEFDNPVRYSAFLKRFFALAGMARHYAVYGEPDLPQFDLIDLQGEQIAERELVAGVKVANLLLDDPLPGIPKMSTRQRMNSAHGRSLMDNSRLGRSLLQLDNHWWAGQIADVISVLQEGHESLSPLVPLFDTLEVTLEGAYRVSMLDAQTGEHVATVINRDSRLLRSKLYLSELFSTLAHKPAPTHAPLDPTEAAAVHTLNAGFAVQSLMNALRAREGEDRTLTTAVRWHAYVNYAQLVHGNVVDVSGLIGLVQTALRDEKIIARTSAHVVGEALGPLAGKLVGAAGHAANEGVGAVLGLANVGFDIYQLANAQNDVETVTYGTQLGFDAASLALTGAGLGAALAGAGTAAAVLGGAGVIFGGLAVGVTALAQAYAMIAEEAKAVGLFFDELEQAHHGSGYHYDRSQAAWLPRASLIFKQVDLSAGKLQLDSTKLYPLRDHFGVPDFEADYSRAINISAELGYPGEMNFAPPADQAIVLPCTPLTCYRYVYQTLPFASQRHDTGFDIARRLEKTRPDGQRLFLFSFYSFPSHYIVYRIYPDYRPTEVSVKLDAGERKLVVPVVPAPWHGKISYRLQGAGGTCTLVLNPGVNVELTTVGGQKNRWIIVAPWASESDIVFGKEGEFSIKDCQFKVSGTVQPDLFVLVDNGSLFSIDGRVLKLLQDEAPKGVDNQLLQDHLQALARAHRLVLRYTPIHDYLIPFEKTSAPRYTSGWYDANEDRILYVRNDEVSDDDVLLSVVVGESAFFHDPTSYDIWQVDANTGLLSHRYRLMLKLKGVSTIRSVESDGQGVVHVVQEYVQDDGSLLRFNYLISDGLLWLSSITRGVEPSFAALLDDTAPLTDWAAVLGEHSQLKPAHEGKEYATLDWQLAPYVSICWQIEETTRDMAWVRTRDDLIIRPVPGRHRARGWADSIQKLNDLMLLPVAHDDVFVIYDRRLQSLCRVQCTLADGRARWAHRWIQPEGLQQIAAHANGYRASTTAGLSFDLGPDGEVRFAGLAEQWLKGRAQWWLALEGVANRYGVDRFAILGVANCANDARLHGWYIDKRLLLCEAAQADVRLLGLTPDNQSAWLFEAASGEVWRQVLIDPQQLDQAFGTGTQLLQAAALPKPERQWTAWRFAEIRTEGAGLLGTTLDGVLLELHFNAQPVITGVARNWVAAHDKQLTHDLQSLLQTRAHRPFISVAAQDASVRWYIVDSARLIRLATADLPKTFELLGTQRHTDILLHEPEARLIQGYPSNRQIRPLDYVQREGDVLAIEGRVDAHDLIPLIPDDVRTLVVHMGRGFMNIHLTQALSRRLDALVVDCRYPLAGRPAVMSRLIWTPDAPQNLQAGVIEDHLMVIDADAGHCVLLRNACASDPSLRGDAMIEVAGLRPFRVSALALWIKGRTGGADSVALTTLLDEMKAGVLVGAAG